MAEQEIKQPESNKIIDLIQVKKRISELEEEISILRKVDKVGDEYTRFRKK